LAELCAHVFAVNALGDAECASEQGAMSVLGELSVFRRLLGDFARKKELPFVEMYLDIVLCNAGHIDDEKKLFFVFINVDGGA
jgi:hypothetical protein